MKQDHGTLAEVPILNGPECDDESIGDGADRDTVDEATTERELPGGLARFQTQSQRLKQGGLVVRQRATGGETPNRGPDDSGWWCVLAVSREP